MEYSLHPFGVFVFVACIKSTRQVSIHSYLTDTSNIGQSYLTIRLKLACHCAKNLSAGSLAAILNRPAAWSESDLLSKHNLTPALDRCSAVASLSRISARSALASATTIYPIITDVSLFVSSSGDKSSLRSLVNRKS